MLAPSERRKPQSCLVYVFWQKRVLNLRHILSLYTPWMICMSYKSIDSSKDHPSVVYVLFACYNVFFKSDSVNNDEHFPDVKLTVGWHTAK